MIDKRDMRKKDIKICQTPHTKDRDIKVCKSYVERFFRNRDILGKLQFQKDLTLILI